MAEYQLPFTGAQVEALMNIVNALADWAKASEKPTYTADEVGARPSTWTPSASEVGADPAGTAVGTVSSHNTAEDAHEDIRLLVAGLTSGLNALADSDDETLDQVSELVAYIKANRELIESVTTGKVGVSDIVDNLTTNVANKPLSAAQGVALKTLIDGITVPTKVSELQNDAGYLTQHQDISGKADTSDLTAHTGNSTVHITAAERTNWNQAVTDVGALSEEIDDYKTLTLGTHSDGKIYLFKNGSPIGTGVEAGVSGDVVGYVDSDNNIIVSGTLAEGTYTVKYEMEDGTLVDIGTLSTVPAPTYTNLADPSSSDWLTDTRISYSSSSGATKAYTGMTTTNFFQVSKGDIIRIKGMELISNSNAVIAFYDSSKAFLSQAYFNGSGVASLEGDVVKTSYIPNVNTAYARFCGTSPTNTSDVIITVNEDIA